MNQDEAQRIETRLQSLEAKVDQVHSTVERLRKYFAITMWVTLVVVVLPAIGLVFVIPAFLNSYTAGLEGLL